MIRFQDLQRIEKKRGVCLSAGMRDVSLKKVCRDLAKRAILGTVVLPLCLLLALVSSGFLNDSLPVSILLCVLMVSPACVRGWVLHRIFREDCQPWRSRLLQMLFISTTCMSAAWGLLTALVIHRYLFGSEVILVMVLSVGVGAGAISSFYIWRDLAMAHLCCSFFPGIVVAGFLGSHELLPIVVAMVFFMFYNAGQLKIWNEQFWDSLLTTQLYKQQSDRLSRSMLDLQLSMKQTKEREHAAESAEEKMRQLFDYSYDGIIIADLNGQVLDVNQTLLNLLEDTAEEVIGRNVLEILRGQARTNDEIQAYLEKAKIGKQSSFSCWMRLKLRHFYMRVNLRRVLWYEHHVIFITLRDRTDSYGVRAKKSIRQQSLTDSEVYMKAILQSIELPLYCKDLQGKYIAVNATFEKICGKDAAKLKNRNDFEVFDEKVAAFFSFRDSEIPQTGESVELEGTFEIGGEERNLLIHKFPLKNEDDTIYATAGICTDVSVIQKTLHAAQLANEAKSEFLASMSHELRTPLHSILCFARLGAKRSANHDWDKLESYFNMIVTSGNLLLELLNDLLDLSTLEALPVCSDMEEHDLGEDVSKIVTEFRALIDENDITLRFQPPLFPQRTRYNQIRIYQVLRNLLSNAIKFSSPGQEIHVEIGSGQLHFEGRLQQAWKVSVIDQGIGVEDDQLELVFDKFVQGKKKGAGRGVGLGLAICKRIIEDHHGLIWAEHNHPSGAIFSFLLPVTSAAEPE